MATVKENLIAAKALIDTPEKWAGAETGCWFGSILGSAAQTAESGSAAYEAVKAALVRQMPHPYRLLATYYDAITAFGDASDHADIMALFDRAIAAQDGAA